MTGITKSVRTFDRRRRWSAPALALCVMALSTACGGLERSEDSEPPAQGTFQRDANVFKLEVGPTGTPHTITEWLDVRTGRWRLEDGDRTLIYTGSDYVVVEGASGYLRRGSPEFIGGLSSLAPGIEALRGQIAGHAADLAPGSAVQFKTHSGVDLEATVVSAISSTKADAQGLFAVPLDRITTTAREVDPGDPTSLPVSPYWFGEALGNHSAVTAVEHETRLTEALRAEGWSETRRDRGLHRFL